MTHSSVSRLFRTLLLGIAAVLLNLAAGGCQDKSGVGKTVPVTGKITLDDQPLTADSTVVLFKPDASKGNTSAFEPTGTVDENGTYTLSTKGKAGAPPGWYKVVVTAVAEPPEHPKTPGKPPHRPVARSLVPAKYGQAKTSGLAIEVVENPVPGAYDLKLRK
jgi:hypothetical protein